MSCCEGVFTQSASLLDYPAQEEVDQLNYLMKRAASVMMQP